MGDGNGIDKEKSSGRLSFVPQVTLLKTHTWKWDLSAYSHLSGVVNYVVKSILNNNDKSEWLIT